MKTMRIFQIHVSRTTVISSASTIAKLVENVSEAVNFGPTKSAARIAQQILETMQEVDENDEARIKLMKKVVDFLLLIREHFEESNAILIVSPNLSRKMRGFEDVLLEIHEDLKPTVKMGLASRIISRDRVRGELAAHSTDLDVAIEKLKLSLLLGIAVATNTPPPKSSSRRRAIPRAFANGERRPVKRPLCDRVFLIQADITTLKVDAVVNAAKNSLLGSFFRSGTYLLHAVTNFRTVDGDIHRVAGPGLLQECKRLNGCATGDAKITNAYDLPARYVIHTVGPVYDSRRATHKADQLASCYFKSLSLAVLHRLRRIAFPAISTGANGYPLEDAIRIALSVTRRFLLSAEGDEIDLVIFTMFSENEQIVYKRLIPEFFPSSV